MRLSWLLRPRLLRRSSKSLSALHLAVVGTLSAFWRRPRDDLVGIRDVAGLAVDAVFVVDKEPFPSRVIGVVHHFVDRGWAEAFAGVSIVPGTDRRADVRIGDFEMVGLVGFMRRPTETDEMFFAEGQLAVELKFFLRPFFGRQFPDFLHGCVTGMHFELVHQASALGGHQQRHIEAKEEDRGDVDGPLPISSFHVFRIGPAVFVALGIVAQCLAGEVLALQGVNDGFGGEHARLDRHMDARQFHRVEHAGRIPHQHGAIAIKLGLRVEAAHGDAFRAISNQFAPF